MHDAVTLMVVDTPYDRILAECPPVLGIQPGMLAEMEQTRGVIKKVIQTIRGSDEYELIRMMSGRPMTVTRITATYYQHLPVAR